MKPWALVIDGPRKGEWIKLNRIGPVQYLIPRDLLWVAELNPLTETPEIGQLYPRQYSSPSWKIPLWFLTGQSTGSVIEHGTVLPGWVQGVELDSEPICRWEHDAEGHVWWAFSLEAGMRVDGVTCETIQHYGFDRIQMVARVPLPEEARNGCPPRPEPKWEPKTPEQIMRILDGERPC